MATTLAALQAITVTDGPPSVDADLHKEQATCQAEVLELMWNIGNTVDTVEARVALLKAGCNSERKLVATALRVILGEIRAGRERAALSGLLDVIGELEAV